MDIYCKPWVGEVGHAAFYSQIAQMDQKYTDEVEPMYSRLDCPVTVLWGKEDAWIPAEMGLALASLISESECRLSSDCGHPAQEDRPRR